MKKYFLIFFICILGAVLYTLYFHQILFPLQNIDFKHRPAGNAHLFDYANILQDVEEYSNNYLKTINDRYKIETLMVSIPSLNHLRTVGEAAVEILNNWKIGKDDNGRGILLLLADKEKQVKLEVSYELEDVFTDIFCGYVEDKQLGPYFLAGQLGTGLLAVMEEIENRAQIKHQGKYNVHSISRLDGILLSGGAGATQKLLEFNKETVQTGNAFFPAGKTPAQAWETLLNSWRMKSRNPNLEIYTHVTRLAYRDFQNLPDSRYEEDVKTYGKKPYEVIGNNHYAVIFFGNKTGWENAPFLFCRTSEGWQFDIVHQRKYIRMGPNPKWGIERTNHPYIDLLAKCPYWMGQDIPLEKQDKYRTIDDKQIAGQIKRLEKKYQTNPADIGLLIELGRLYTITSMGLKSIPILKKAKQFNPDHPLPYKYLAIRYVDSTYQYRKAIQEMKAYVKLKPDDVFGRNFLGYVYFCLKKYHPAITEFNKAVELKKDNCYAFCKLSRCYGLLHLNKSRSVMPISTHSNKQLTIEMQQKAQQTVTPDARRITWLKSWLRKNKLL
ncbi:MAG: TPM domain-containing protein [Thermodesulfobacteriota bacterium]|nr:TPM domain-containing protein [Thermodesulfobacteriota bacterium]